MNFLAPERFVLLLPVLALAVAYVVLLRRRRRYAVRFTNLDLLDSVAPRRPGWRRHVAAGLAGAAAVLCVVGLARPVAAQEVASEDATIVLAIDTSLSMDATDVQPSRVDAARAEAIEFVESLPDEFEVGVVAFDGTTQVLATPTDDREAVVAAISALRTGRGTAGGDAIEAALAVIEADATSPVQGVVSPDPAADAGSDLTPDDTSDSAPAATIVLLSDGATTVGVDVVEAAQEAAAAGIPISTITYGTDAGSVTVDGQTIAVPPDTATMEQVADLTGGTAFRAASADELATVYADIGARVETVVEQRELSLGFVAAGLAALLAAATAAFAWTGRFL
jgi:Ca-activated chloride channel family protein